MEEETKKRNVGSGDEKNIEPQTSLSFQKIYQQGSQNQHFFSFLDNAEKETLLPLNTNKNKKTEKKFDFNEFSQTVVKFFEEKYKNLNINFDDVKNYLYLSIFMFICSIIVAVFIIIVGLCLTAFIVIYIVYKIYKFFF